MHHPDGNSGVAFTVSSDSNLCGQSKSRYSASDYLAEASQQRISVPPPGMQVPKKDAGNPDQNWASKSAAFHMNNESDFIFYGTFAFFLIS